MKVNEISEKNIRQPVVAGSFYTANPKVLAQEIKSYLNNVPVGQVISEKPIGLISPHAGYIYSGQVAAFAYKQIEGRRYEAIMIIAPSHQVYFHGASVDTKDGYRTPLGVVPVAKEIVNQIFDKSPLITHYPQAHLQEHSLEVQIPFLQTVVGDFKLIPMVMGDQTIETCQVVARVLANVIKNHDILVVASSDLSHYHPSDIAQGLDQKVIDRINAFDPQGLALDLRLHKTEACGGGPIITALLIGERLGANKARVVKYANSGDVSGDYSGVVGYAAGVIYKENEQHAKKPGKKQVGVDLGLNEHEKELLHRIARETIKSYLEGKPLPTYQVDSPTLQELRGAFVSLHKEGMLRGCIGHIRADLPLHAIIKEMAIAAAFEDPRFPPLQPEEFDKVEIEISVLTPFKKITDINEIEIGKHGLYIVRGFYSGLLLPQVATEYGWDRVTFLEHACNKAGLPKDAWKEKDTQIYIFSADVF
ncbi:MAG TPA: AmmeMemoRadiSam system protein B [Thermodesulfobacteriota bacterium]|nr:AmmeMemoRadiSam system protein B [Thermodesulfobacteriota bacterium]